MSDDSTLYGDPASIACPTCGMPAGRACARLDGGGSLSGGWHSARERIPTIAHNPQEPTVPTSQPAATVVIEALRRAGIPARVHSWEGPGGILELEPELRGPAMATLATLGCASAVHPRGLATAVPEPEAHPVPVEAPTGSVRVVITCRQLTPRPSDDLIDVASWLHLHLHAELEARGLVIEAVDVQR